MPITGKVKKFIAENSLIAENDRVLVALSGGGDSVAMLRILCALSSEIGFRLCAAHFNHLIRGAEAVRDQEFSRKLSEDLGVPFYLGSSDIPRIAAESGRTIEECARDERYRFLFDVAKKTDCNKLATAHHATDNIETVLFHMIRGSGTNGLVGISPYRSDGVIRPLLSCSKAEIDAYLAANSADFVTDSTNADTLMTRNFIRAEMLPLIRKINPAVETAIGRLSRGAAEDEEYFLSEAKKIPDNAPLTFLRGIPVPILKRYIKLRYDREKGCQAQLEYGHISELCRAITDGNRRFRYSLPGNTAAVSDGRYLEFIADKTTIHPFQKLLTSPGEYSVGNGSIMLTNSRDELFGWLDTHSGNEYTVYPYEGEFPEITARSRLPGDKYLRGGMHRTVRKELNAIGYPAHKRASLPCLCDKDGIFWVPGLPPGDTIKIPQNKISKQLIYIGYTEN